MGQYTDVEQPSIKSISIDQDVNKIEFRYDIFDPQSGLREVGFYLHNGSSIVTLGSKSVQGYRDSGRLTAITDKDPDRYRFYVEDENNNRTYVEAELEDEQ